MIPTVLQLTMFFKSHPLHCMYQQRFLLLSSSPLYEYTTISWSILRLMDIWVFFHFGTNINKATMTILVLTFGLGYITGNGIAGSRARCACMFIRNYQTACQSGCAILHSHRQCMRASAAPRLSYQSSKFSHSSGCIIISPCSLNLQFPDGSGR